jgi:hypothetical protein
MLMTAVLLPPAGSLLLIGCIVFEMVRAAQATPSHRN